MKRTPILLVAMSATLLIASCKNSGTTGLLVPRDAAMVIDINMSSLTSKLSWNDIKQTSWFKEMSEKQHDSLTQKLLENPENSGIDLKSDLAFFAKKQGGGGYFVFEGKLKNSSDFEASLKKMHGNENIQVQKDGNLSYFTSTEKQGLIAWTDSKFFAIHDAPEFGNTNMMFNEGSRQRTSYPADSLKRFVKDLLDLKGSNSMDDDDKFSALVKESGDVHLWINPGQFMEGMGGGMFSMLKINNLIQGNVATATLNFDDGKITVKANHYYNDEMKKLMEKNKNRSVDEALINRIPSQNVIAAVAVNFDPASTKEFFKASGMDGMINGFVGKYGLSLDEIFNSMNGQFLASVSDVEIKKHEVTVPGMNEDGKPYTYTSTSPTMKVLVAIAVNDRKSFDKILGLAKNMFGEDTSTVHYRLTNEWFLGGSSSQVIDQFLAGGNNHLPFAGKISGHPFGMYIDLQKAIQVGGSQLKNATDSAEYDASVKMWQDVVITGGDYSRGVAKSEFVINLMDKNTNSLKQINLYADKMAAAQKLRPKPEYYNMPDSTVGPKTEVSPAQ